MRRTADARWIRPFWLAVLFGGTFEQTNGGFGWRPNIWRLTRRYYVEGWSDRYSLLTWLRVGR